MAIGGIVRKPLQFITGSTPVNFDFDVATMHPDGSMPGSQWFIEVTFAHFDAFNNSYSCCVQNSVSVTVSGGTLTVRPATYTHPESFGVNYIAISFSNPSGTTLRITLTKLVGGGANPTISGHIAITLFGTPGFA